MNPPGFCSFSDLPVDVKEIKQRLLSRDKEQQSQIVEIIKEYLQDEEVVVELITNDIPEFLCDALVPFDSGNTRSIYNCLEIMAQHELFFRHGHSSFAMESIIRSVHFFMKNRRDASHLSRAIKLLVAFVEGYNKHEIEHERQPVEQLIQLLPELLANEHNQTDVNYQTLLLVNGFVTLKWFKSDEDWHKIFISSVNLCCRLIDEMEIMNPWSEKIINVGNALSAKILGFLRYAEVVSHDCKLKNELITNVLDFLMEYGAPYVAELPLCEVEAEPSRSENFFQAIIHSMDEPLAQQLRISHRLSGLSFLHLITKIITFAEFSHGEDLRKLCLVVLSKMIISLSDDVFQFPLMWPEGKDHFNAEMLQGMSLLPLDASQWLDILSCKTSPRSAKLALTVYLYFYSLTAKSPDVTGTIFPAIAKFLSSVSGIGSNILLVKTIWFVFVMSQLSKNTKSCQTDNEEALSKMLEVLKEQEDLDLVYTHHPAMLYWGFSSPRISTDVQCKIVHLWLENKTIECRELDDLMEKSSEVRFAVLDLLQNETGTTVRSAFLSVKELIERTQDDEIVSTIWYILPRVLANYTTNRIKDTNVNCLLELATLQTPLAPNMSNMTRTAALLSDVLFNSESISFLPGMRLICKLLALSADMEDFRVVNAFWRSDGFVQKIADQMTEDKPEIVISSLDIIALFWRFQKQVDVSQIDGIAAFQLDIVFSFLKTNDPKLMKSSLELLEQLLRTNFTSNVFQLIGSVNDKFLRALQYRLCNICVKDIPGTTEQCWTCLTHCIATDVSPSPWLHELIRIRLSALKDSPQMQKFIIAWLDKNFLAERHFLQDRLICTDYFSETVTFLAAEILKWHGSGCGALPRKVLESGVALQDRVKQQLVILCQD